MKRPSRVTLPARVILTLTLALLVIGERLQAADCNQNGVEDRLDVLPQLAPRLPLRIPAGSFPGAVAVADLDGDQDLDLVVSDFLSLVIISNQGPGDFRKTAEVPLTLSPTGLLVTDLDGDGSQDLAVTASNVQAPHADVGVFVILNRGDGTFKSPLKLLPEGGPRSPAVLDLDGDGSSDLAVANQISGSVSLFRNVGGGNFAPAESISVGSTPGSLHAAQIDGDDGTDLVLLAGAPLRRVVLLAGQDEAGFAEPRDLYSQAGLTDLKVADMDGDGLEDIVLSRFETDRIILLRNLGVGEFAAPLEFSTARGPALLLPADLNGDGAFDLVVAPSGSGTLSLMMNTLRGGFQGAQDYYVGRLSGEQFAAGDLDGDGDVDLVATLSTSRSVVLVENLGRGRFAAPAAAPRELADAPNFLRGADLDGDGDLDLVLVHSGATGTGQISTLLNNGLGAFTPGVDLPAPEQLAMVDVLDVDSDGHPDIVVGQRSGFLGLVLFLNNGDGTFGPPVNSVSTGYMSSFTSADFDGDGVLDLVLPIEFPAGIEILPNAGGGKFKAPVTLSWTQKVFSPPVFMTAGDFTGDGLADVIVGPYDDLPARLYASRGSLRFAVPLTLPGVSFSYYVANADLDGDRDLDLVSADASKLSVYMNDGKGKFAAAVEYPTVPNPISLGIADVDGDRAPDVLLALQGELNPDLGEGELLILVNDGQGRFPRTLSLHPGYRPAGWVLGDLDGDGGTDLVVVNEGHPSGLFPPPASLAFINYLTKPPHSIDRGGDGIPDECQSPPFHRGDANGDGDLDVSDGLCLLQFLFSGGGQPPCREAADSNSDGRIDCADPVFTLGYLFLGTEPPASPGPPGRPCGVDPDLQGEPGYLGCERYDHCGASR